MLPARKRLAAAEVREILKSGKAVRSGHLLLKYCPARSGAAAVVVSKKVAKSAVARNRIRRSIYRELARALPATKHIVILVQKNMPEYSADIETLCSKLS